VLRRDGERLHALPLFGRQRDANGVRRRRGWRGTVLHSSRRRSADEDAAGQAVSSVRRGNCSIPDHRLPAPARTKCTSATSSNAGRRATATPKTRRRHCREYLTRQLEVLRPMSFCLGSCACEYHLLKHAPVPCGKLPNSSTTTRAIPSCPLITLTITHPAVLFRPRRSGKETRGLDDLHIF